MQTLVESLKDAGIIKSDRVVEVMRKVDRGKYVPAGLSAYSDSPQPIGDGQTISAPHMHGQALELLQPFLVPGSKALDIGCGSGYLSACMGRLVYPGGKVVGVENRESLVELSRNNISNTDAELLVSKTVEITLGNGWTGEGFQSDKLAEGVYDAIHVGAAAETMPESLINILKRPGRMVIPVGPQWGSQAFTVVDKDKHGSVSFRELMSVMYVPLEHQTRTRGH